MSDLAIPADVLECHLLHIVDGVSQRDIARQQGLESSTVTRRIQRIEDLRDHPDWDLILTRLEAFREDNPATKPIDRDAIARALGTDFLVVRQQFQRVVSFLARQESVLLVGDVADAAVTSRRARPHPIKREAALCGIAYGWAEPVGDHDGAVRRFVSTEKLLECLNPEPHPLLEGKTYTARRYLPEPPLDVLYRRQGQTLISEDHLRLSREFHEAYVLRETEFASGFEAARNALPPRTLELLSRVCGEHEGLEAVEKAMNLPSRSAKALISFALDAYGHALTP